MYTQMHLWVSLLEKWTNQNSFVEHKPADDIRIIYIVKQIDVKPQMKRKESL